MLSFDIPRSPISTWWPNETESKANDWSISNELNRMPAANQ
jgi:hypothetical protein